MYSSQQRGWKNFKIFFPVPHTTLILHNPAFRYSSSSSSLVFTHGRSFKQCPCNNWWNKGRESIRETSRAISFWHELALFVGSLRRLKSWHIGHGGSSPWRSQPCHYSMQNNLKWVYNFLKTLFHDNTHRILMYIIGPWKKSWRVFVLIYKNKVKNEIFSKKNYWLKIDPQIRRKIHLKILNLNSKKFPRPPSMYVMAWKSQLIT